MKDNEIDGAHEQDRLLECHCHTPPRFTSVNSASSSGRGPATSAVTPKSPSAMGLNVIGSPALGIGLALIINVARRAVPSVLRLEDPARASARLVLSIHILVGYAFVLYAVPSARINLTAWLGIFLNHRA